MAKYHSIADGIDDLNLLIEAVIALGNIVDELHGNHCDMTAVQSVFFYLHNSLSDKWPDFMDLLHKDALPFLADMKKAAVKV